MSNHARHSWILIALIIGATRAPLLAAPATPAAPAPAATPAARAPAATPAARAAQAQVLARERAWLDAIERSDPDALAEILADDFVATTPDGRVVGKSDLLARRRAPRPPGERRRLTTSGVVALVHDNVVVLIGRLIDTITDAQGTSRTEEVAYTDTWVRDGATWRALSSQLTKVVPTP